MVAMAMAMRGSVKFANEVLCHSSWAVVAL
jgi:hypothetical protein